MRMSEPKDTETRLRELEAEIVRLNARIEAQNEESFKSIDLVFERIEKHNAALDDHEARLKSLMKELSSISELVGRIGKRTSREAEEQHRFMMTLNTEVKALAERVNMLELTVFPKSAEAYSQLFNIIGTEPTLRNNPLDRKKE
jgi:hypothetical protein